MNRVAFLIDGFNLYHSARQASRDLQVGTKWLDISGLCRSYLHLFGRGSTLQGVHYFSALAHHIAARDPQVVVRHQAFLECLRETGVAVELARFKPKTVYCDLCGGTLTRYEEKETDVAIAAKLFELLQTGACDTVVLMSGDTDLAPGVRIANKLFPSCPTLFAFPYKRKNKELAKLAPSSFVIGRGSYVTHQLPDPVVTAAGKKIYKPAGW